MPCAPRLSLPGPPSCRSCRAARSGLSPSTALCKTTWFNQGLSFLSWHFSCHSSLSLLFYNNYIKNAMLQIIFFSHRIFSREGKFIRLRIQNALSRIWNSYSRNGNDRYCYIYNPVTLLCFISCSWRTSHRPLVPTPVPAFDTQDVPSIIWSSIIWSYYYLEPQ